MTFPVSDNQECIKYLFYTNVITQELSKIHNISGILFVWRLCNIYESVSQLARCMYINILYDSRHCFADDIIYYTTQPE
jgi:hypothetical protein